MSGQVRAAGNVLQPAEALAGKAGGDTGKLAMGTQVGKPLTREAKGADVLGLVGSGGRRRLEALLREIGAAVDVDLLVRVGLDVVEDLAQQLVGEAQQAGGGGVHVHAAESRGVGVGASTDGSRRVARAGWRRVVLAVGVAGVAAQSVVVGWDDGFWGEGRGGMLRGYARPQQSILMALHHGRRKSSAEDAAGQPSAIVG